MTVHLDSEINGLQVVMRDVLASIDKALAAPHPERPPVPTVKGGHP